jgi:hypothetical protein
MRSQGQAKAVLIPPFFLCEPTHSSALMPASSTVAVAVSTKTATKAVRASCSARRSTLHMGTKCHPSGMKFCARRNLGVYHSDTHVRRHGEGET